MALFMSRTMCEANMGRTVLIVGGGGREHALALGLVESPSVASVHVAPGNAGTEAIATNHDVSAADVVGQVELAKSLGVDLVVVGPEAPLVAGLSDLLRTEGIPSFGPHAAGAMLEGSKDFAKQVMLDLEIPTAKVQHLTAEIDLDEAVDKWGAPWVVKRDVLAGGKGVVVTDNRDEALDFITESIESDGMVLLEEFLSGEVKAWGILQNRSGKVTRQFSAILNGKWNGKELILDEKFNWDDGEVQKRQWKINKIDEHNYEGTAGDVVGKAKGFSYGPAFKFEYVLLVPVKGKEMKITFDDWIFMQDEKVAINRAKMTKFGIRVADLTVVFVKD